MGEWISDLLNIENLAHARLVATGIVVVVVVAGQLVVRRAAARRIDDSEILFRTQKSIIYVATFILLLLLGWVWIDAFDNVATFLGLLSAGIAIALSDVLKNLAGWVYILLRHPFRVGHRIEIDGHAGDVIDLRVFRFSMLEIRNWVGGDQSTGRIIHIPNGAIFTKSMANFTEGFPYVWHEVPVLFTFESDWERAEEIMRKVLEPHAMSDEEMGAERRIREASRKYFIRYTELRPIVYVDVKDSGVLLTARLLVSAQRRRGTNDEIWRALLKEIAAEPSVELAYPTTRMVIHHPLQIQRGD